MPSLNPERLARIVAAAQRYTILTTITEATPVTEHGDRVNFHAEVAERELFDAVTPDTTLIIMQADAGGYHRPVIWCPDEDWAREFLEHHAFPETLSVWELQRAEGDGVDITDAFCEKWFEDVADFTRDEDDFLSSLPEFVRVNWGDEAMVAYHGAQARHPV